MLPPAAANIHRLGSIRVILSIGFILGSLLIIIIAGVTLDNSEDALSVILRLEDQ